MLYKKYHRNFVKQFKIGAKFRWSGSDRPYMVEVEPFYSKGNNCIEVSPGHYLWWKLIKSNGKLIKYDVI